MSGKLKVKGDVMKGKPVDGDCEVYCSSLFVPSDEDGAYPCKGTDQSQAVELLRLDHVIIPIHTNRQLTFKPNESLHLTSFPVPNTNLT